MLTILKVNYIDTTAVNFEVIIFIIGISIKVVTLSTLDNNPFNIVPIHIKVSIRLKFYEPETLSNHASYSAFVVSITLESHFVF